jgi:hypothetical protein
MILATMMFGLCQTYKLKIYSRNRVLTSWGGLNVWEIKSTERHFFQTAIVRLDYENSKDPVMVNDTAFSTYYSSCICGTLNQLSKDLSDEVVLAGKSLKLNNWKVQRSMYSLSKEGYLKWKEARRKIAALHSKKILTEVGYEQTRVEYIQSLILGHNHDRGGEYMIDLELLNDAKSIVFFLYRFPNLFQNDIIKNRVDLRVINEHALESLKSIMIAKTIWQKMSIYARSICQRELSHADNSKNEILQYIMQSSL